jgi:hypothetical protein
VALSLNKPKLDNLAGDVYEDDPTLLEANFRAAYINGFRRMLTTS